MINILKNRIFIFILGGIIFSSITVVASGLFASDITYDNTTSHLKDTNNQDVTTVQGAIDVLYAKANLINTAQCSVGSFVPDSKITTSTGYKITLGFRPSYWCDFIPAISWVDVLDKRANNYIYWTDGARGAATPYGNFYVMDNTSITIKNYTQDVVNKTIYYVACK